MSLSQDILVTEFRKIVDPDFSEFEGAPESTEIAAIRWTDAYDLYAQEAEDLSGDYVNSVNKLGFEAALNFSLTSSSLQLAQQFSTAWAAYWTGAIFKILNLILGPGVPCPNIGGTGLFVSEVSSVVSVVNSLPLLAALTTEFGKETIDGEAKARDLATIFHTATTTNILVLITGVDVTPVAITNLCRVF